jgi:hypothetical protein
MSSTRPTGAARARGSGQYEGRDLGGSVSVILVSTDEPGAGRRCTANHETTSADVRDHRGEPSSPWVARSRCAGRGDRGRPRRWWPTSSATRHRPAGDDQRPRQPVIETDGSRRTPEHPFALTAADVGAWLFTCNPRESASSTPPPSTRSAPPSYRSAWSGGSAGRAVVSGPDGATPEPGSGCRRHHWRCARPATLGGLALVPWPEPGARPTCWPIPARPRMEGCAAPADGQPVVTPAVFRRDHRDGGRARADAPIYSGRRPCARPTASRGRSRPCADRDRPARAAAFFHEMPRRAVIAPAHRGPTGWRSCARGAAAGTAVSRCGCRGAPVTRSPARRPSRAPTTASDDSVTRATRRRSRARISSGSRSPRRPDGRLRSIGEVHRRVGADLGAASISTGRPAARPRPARQSASVPAHGHAPASAPHRR